MMTAFNSLRMFHTSGYLLSNARLNGTVKWFNWRKGFGFITPSESTGRKDEIFVHQTNIVSATGFRMLQDGQEVSFEVRSDPTGRPQAYEVKQADGSPVSGKP